MPFKLIDISRAKSLHGAAVRRYWLFKKKEKVKPLIAWRTGSDSGKPLRYHIIGKCGKMIWLVRPLRAIYHQTRCCTHVNNALHWRLKYRRSTVCESIPYLFVVSFDGTLKRRKELSKARISRMSWIFHISFEQVGNKSRRNMSDRWVGSSEVVAKNFIKVPLSCSAVWSSTKWLFSLTKSVHTLYPNLKIKVNEGRNPEKL